jgi:hypothetical protein
MGLLHGYAIVSIVVDEIGARLGFDALRLRADDRSTRAGAEMVRDCSPHGPIRWHLRVMFSRYRRGQVKAVPFDRQSSRGSLRGNPRPVSVIATELGLSPRQVRNLLYRRGYDAEVRNELIR